MIPFHKKMTYLAVILVFGLAVGCGIKKEIEKKSAAVQEDVLYQCSMHPQVVSHKPGNCPICGMPLTRVDSKSKSSVEKKEHKLLFYRHPMNPSVTSPVPAKDEMGMDYIPVYEDEITEASEIPGHAMTSIRPERQQLMGLKTVIAEEKPLALKIRTFGQMGYDPDMFDAILQYREAMIAARRLRGNPSTIASMLNNDIIELATKKLRLAGLSDRQIDGLIRFNQLSDYFQLPPNSDWAYADIYEFESDLVKPGQKVKITAPSIPGKSFEGEIRSVDEVFYASNRIQRARIEVFNAEGWLKPGLTLNVEIDADLGIHVALPRDAVIDSGEQQIVFIDRGEGKLEPKKVRAGYEAGDEIEILEGVEPGEKVVASAVFLVDSESRLQAASQNFIKNAEKAGAQ